MAKLKITDANGNILVDGYVNVVTQMVFTPDANTEQRNLRDFLDAEPENRPTMLQKFTDPNATGQFIVKQERFNGNLVAIDDDNCRIVAQKDAKQRARNRSRVTMPIPDAPISDFSYLDDYARNVHDLFETDREKCRRFMFGVMMLTRCR